MVSPDDKAKTFCGTVEYLSPEIVLHKRMSPHGLGYGMETDWLVKINYISCVWFMLCLLLMWCDDGGAGGDLVWWHLSC